MNLNGNRTFTGSSTISARVFGGTLTVDGGVSLGGTNEPSLAVKLGSGTVDIASNNPFGSLTIGPRINNKYVYLSVSASGTDRSISAPITVDESFQLFGGTQTLALTGPMTLTTCCCPS